MSDVSHAELEQEITRLIREFSTAKDMSVEQNMTFDQLGISSLDVLQLIFRVEENHGVTIETDGFHEVKTVDDVVGYVHGAIRSEVT